MATFLVSLCCAVFPAAGEDAKRVAIFPFQIHSEKDLSFLQKGIVDMLSSRLAQSGKVSVINRQQTEQALAETDGPMEVDEAKRIGGKLGADYVLFGSLTVFGNSVSIDAKMVDVTGEAEPVAVFTQSEMGQVIAEINQFAVDINEKVFGHTVVAKQRAAPAGQPAPAPEAAAPKEATPEIYAHPEKLIQSGFGVEGSPDSGKFEGRQRYWKSRNFTHAINGLTLGDVDGDGMIETVIASPNSVRVYRYQDKRFFEVGATDPVKFRTIVGLDIADINGNGIPEIFVSALNAQRNGVTSSVLEYDGSGFPEVVKDANYYFRVARLRDRGSVLFGQRQRSDGSPFSSAIYEMHWDGVKYGTRNRVLPAKKTNLLGFTMGDPMNSGEDKALAFDDSDYLRILEPSGRDVWTSGSRYGGSTLFIASKQDKGEILHKTYMPMRVQIVDVEEDGTYEVAVARNIEVTGARLSQFRLFNQTEMVILSWDGVGLAPVWKTRTLSGMIRDFAVGDFDNDGKNELVGALISKEGTTVGVQPKSAVIALDLN